MAKRSGELQGPSILLKVEHPSGARAGRLLARRAVTFLVQLGLLDRELSLVVTTDRRIRTLNRTWREKDKATDVLS
ncbi:MAG: rRNA maturation RNAse YbeY, partial [Myxococcales bacterium]